MLKLLVTGSCGFIGQNFVRLFKDKYNIMGFDKLDYASDREAIKLCPTVIGDICNKELVFDVVKRGKFDAIISFAAASHVDNSIKCPEPFIYSNIVGAFNIFEAARQNGIKRVISIGTDEEYGDLQIGDPAFSNIHLLKPSSPYSASKTAASLLALAYCRTYDMDIVITRSCNNYGPYQYTEKLIPMVITRAMEDKEITIHGTGTNIREWIYVDDNCLGIEAALLNGKGGNVYHIGSGSEMNNITITKKILEIMGKPESLIKYVEDRKGNDFRYALDRTKTNLELGWKANVNMEDGLKKTIDWYMNNAAYWRDSDIFNYYYLERKYTTDH
jgi:dTDP-glucose 4,6-dehydratase